MLNLFKATHLYILSHLKIGIAQVISHEMLGTGNAAYLIPSWLLIGVFQFQHKKGLYHRAWKQKNIINID